MTDLALLGTELCYWWEPASDASPTEPDTPAVFRWMVREPDAGPVVEVFVGETPRLSSPGGVCGGPEGNDCCTLHERLREHRSRGREVLLEVLRFTHFEIGGRRVTQGSLSDRSVRRLLESLFAFQHAQEGHRVLTA